LGDPASSYATAGISQDHSTTQAPPLLQSGVTFGGDLHLNYGSKIIRAFYISTVPALCISRLTFLRLVTLMFGEECALRHCSLRNARF
jgi:hypothetical protein